MAPDCTRVYSYTLSGRGQQVIESRERWGGERCWGRESGVRKGQVLQKSSKMQEGAGAIA